MYPVLIIMHMLNFLDTFSRSVTNFALKKGKEDGRKNWKPRGKIGISCVVVIVTSSN